MFKVKQRNENVGKLEVLKNNFRKKKINMTNYRGQLKAGTSHKMQSVPFIFSMSRFQGPAFGCDKIAYLRQSKAFQTKI